MLLVENICYNLISISQLCDNGYLVEFHKYTCIIKDKDENTLLVGSRNGNNYKIDWKYDQSSNPTCFNAFNDDKY